MQNGSLMRAARRRGPDVWEFRWREPGPDGRRVHRRIIVGTVKKLKNETAAGKVIAGLRREINSRNFRLKARFMTIAQLADHYRQRELTPENHWKSYSTRMSYDGYLRKWIVPRWGNYTLSSIRTIEVESWLRHLPLARGSCVKIRNVMSVLFNHARRYDLFDRNPMSLVRQSAKRRTFPEVLSVDEIKQLVDALSPRERTLVLLAAGTGLRMGELFGLKWKDIDFVGSEVSVTRSIVNQVVGPCKTEASQKPVPLDAYLAQALQNWFRQAKYSGSEDWVFASAVNKGKNPYRGQALMKFHIRPAARRLGIMKKLGWHTFRHTYSTLLRATGADIKVMQELLRHASCRVTMDTYTQAVTPAKRLAQSTVVSLFHKPSEAPAAPVAVGATLNANPLPLVPICAYDEAVKSPQVIDLKVASPTGFEPVLSP